MQLSAVVFDFDGVIVDDEAESQYASGGLPLFHHHEVEHRKRPLGSGPLMPLLKHLSMLQRLERAPGERQLGERKGIAGRLGDQPGRQGSDPGGGELDGQRDAIHAGTDASDLVGDGPRVEAGRWAARDPRSYRK